MHNFPFQNNQILTELLARHSFSYFVLNFGSTNLSRPLLTLEVNPSLPNTRFVHPQFNPTSNVNNVALLRLPIPVPINLPTIASVRLPTNAQANRPFTELSGNFTGHGRVANISPESQRLRVVQLRIIPLPQCVTVYGAAVANANVLCTVGSEFEAQGPCDMDFGGGLVIQENNGQTVVGIHSFVSSNGCVFGQPAGFVRLGGYLEWINHKAGLAPRN